MFQEVWQQARILHKPIIAQSFSPNLAQDGRQTCRPAANFSVTKMQEENSRIMTKRLSYCTTSLLCAKIIFCWTKMTGNKILLN
jgi:hypothetical protein